MSAKRKLPVAITIEDSFKPNLEQLPAIDDIASIKLTPVGKDDAEPGTPKVQMLVCRLRLSPNHHTCMYQVVCGVADVANSDGKRPDVIENKPGKAGSVRRETPAAEKFGKGGGRSGRTKRCPSFLRSACEFLTVAPNGDRRRCYTAGGLSWVCDLRGAHRGCPQIKGSERLALNSHPPFSRASKT
eukprot:3001628-Rhodomonas_salina.1